VVVVVVVVVDVLTVWQERSSSEADVMTGEAV